MKKLFISILAVAAAVACTKTNVDFEQPAEIGFAPVASMSSKAAINDGVYPTNQPIGIWSNYDGTVDPTVADANQSPDYTNNFKTAYINNKMFVNRETTANWGGETPYYWPTNGSLVFAGYSIPAGGKVNSSASYDFSKDVMTITDYVQSLSTADTHDLLWFGRTDNSYNYRNAPTAVPVEFHHALSWITIKVKGEGTAVAADNVWAIKSVKLNNVINKGTATLKGTEAKWALSTTNTDKGAMAVFTTSESKSSQSLTANAVVIEDVTNGTVVLPQTPVKLEVSYSYNTPAGAPITEKKEVELTLDAKNSDNNVWKPGYHYTYTLTFKSNEILVAPTVEAWKDGGNTGVTVE